MKKMIFTAALMLGLQFSMAQSQETIFNNVDNLGFYLGANLQAGPLAGETAAIFDLKGAVILNQNFAVGGTYSFSINDVVPASAEQNTYLDMQLGGLLLEYTLNPGKAVHFTFPLSIGAGEIQYDWLDDPTTANDDPFGEENFFFIEPGAMLEFNLLKNVRLNLGATYRLIPGGVDYRGLTAADISGITGSAGLKVGLFR